jgi:ribonuclease P protein component
MSVASRPPDFGTGTQTAISGAAAFVGRRPNRASISATGTTSAVFGTVHRAQGSCLPARLEPGSVRAYDVRECPDPCDRAPCPSGDPDPGSGRGRMWMDETHVSAERAQAGQDPRVPQAHVEQGRTGHHPVAPGQGSPASVGVSARRSDAGASATRIGPVRRRQTFDLLRHSRHLGRSGPIVVGYVEQTSWSKAEVAYAIGRPVGTAVTRNRLRRRLRAIVAEAASSLPAGAYVVRAGPEASRLGYDELKVAMGRALERAIPGRADGLIPVAPADPVGSTP